MLRDEESLKEKKTLKKLKPSKHERLTSAKAIKQSLNIGCTRGKSGEQRWNPKSKYLRK